MVRLEEEQVAGAKGVAGMERSNVAMRKVIVDERDVILARRAAPRPCAATAGQPVRAAGRSVWQRCCRALLARACPRCRRLWEAGEEAGSQPVVGVVGAGHLKARSPRRGGGRQGARTRRRSPASCLQTAVLRKSSACMPCCAGHRSSLGRVGRPHHRAARAAPAAAAARRARLALADGRSGCCRRRHHRCAATAGGSHVCGGGGARGGAVHRLHGSHRQPLRQGVCASAGGARLWSLVLGNRGQRATAFLARPHAILRRSLLPSWSAQWRRWTLPMATGPALRRTWAGRRRAAATPFSDAFLAAPLAARPPGRCESSAQQHHCSTALWVLHS